MMECWVLQCIKTYGAEDRQLKNHRVDAVEPVLEITGVFIYELCDELGFW